MDLQISVFLLFSLFTAGHSLSCNVCTSGTCTQPTCPSVSTNCSGFTIINGTAVAKSRGCVEASLCVNGFMSLGAVRASSSCCNTDLCNTQDAPDPSFSQNGKNCYSCDGATVKNCSNVLSCSGTEDRCFSASVVNQPVFIKGCASKSACDAKAAVSITFNLANFSCCEGNMCNGAPSVSQSFLFLCCSLLSYFLLH